jgi:antitoxin MazE
MRVSKWGNSLAIRLPAGDVGKLGLKAGDSINIRVAGPGEFLIERQMTREEAIAALRAGRTPLPADYKFDREEANSRGRNK